MSSKLQVEIRYAKREDVTTILSMVQELAAAHDIAAQKVFTTEASLLESLTFDTADFCPSRPARALLICDGEGKPVGMALYFYNYSTWRSRAGIYLEDLYVRPEERGKGYGKRLLRELAKLVTDADTADGAGGRLEWSVSKHNLRSFKFFQSLGAKPMNEWLHMRVEEEDLTRLAGRDEMVKA